MFEEKSLILFIEGVLTQLVSILNLSDNPAEIKAKDAYFVTLKNDEFSVLATAGKFKKEDTPNILTTDATDLLHEAYEKKE